MSKIFVFIATKSTVDAVVPTQAASQAAFNRRVHDAFGGLAGGTITVGDLKLRPTAAAVTNHLLCDGTEVAKASFPELFDYLGTSEGTATDPANFVIPNYVETTLEAAPAADTPPQTIDNATVSTGGEILPGGDTGGTTGGNVASGARPALHGNEQQQ